MGRLEGEGAAAALGGLAVSTTVFNFSFKLFNFLAVTGPLVASQIAAAAAKRASTSEASDGAETATTTSEMEIGAGRAAAAETVRGAMTLAVALGISATLALEIGADGVLAWAGGNGSRDVLVTNEQTNEGSGPTMRGEAEAYLRVRALSAPAALVGTVAVGAFRGLLDTKTPLLVSGGANLVNLALDPILIFGFGPVPAFGVAGAAAATTAAEWIAAAAFWALLVARGSCRARSRRRKKRRGRKKPRRTARAREDATRKSRKSRRTPRRHPERRSRLGGGDQASGGGVGVSAGADALAPSRAGARHRRGGGRRRGGRAPDLHTGLVGHALRAGRARGRRAVARRRQPGRGGRARRARAADRSLFWALAAGTAVGVGLLAAAGPAVPGLFTDDAALARAAAPSLTSVALLQPLNAAVFVGDGVLQGAADFEYLAVAMAAAATPALVSLSVVGGATAADVAAGAGAAATSAAALEGVWRSMALLQLGRAATLSWRYWGKQGPVAVGGGRGKGGGEGKGNVGETPGSLCSLSKVERIFTRARIYLMYDCG